MTIKFNRIIWLRPESVNETYDSDIKRLGLLGASVRSVCYRNEVLRLGIFGAREKILKTIEDFDSDLVLVSFYSDTYELSPEFLREISAKAPLVVHAGDDEIFGTWQTIYFAQSANAVLSGDFDGGYIYNQLSIPWVYYFSSTLDLASVPEVKEKTIDVSYVGNLWRSDRKVYLDFLRKNGIKVEVYGEGSERGFLSRRKIREILSISKINLNFTKRDIPPEILKREPWRAYFKHFSGRAFDAAMMKSFCLSEYCLGIGEMLTVGQEVDVFHDKEELLTKVRYYLAIDAEREEMALKAYDRVVKEQASLDYLARIYNLLYEEVHRDREKVERNPVFRSFDFNASEVRGNFFIFLGLLRLRRFTLAFGVVPYFLRFDLSCLVGLWRGFIELASNLLLGRKWGFNR